jgi:uncharacterized protein YecE (DUF72 family)
VGNFFPKGTRPDDFLGEYARRLTTVEGNTTFYAVPSVKMVAEWSRDMPPGFQFCPKLPRAVSHSGHLAEKIEAARQFVEIMLGFDERLGPMFLQLPPNYGPRQKADLQAFLEAWQDGVRLAVEVRHQDWFGEPAAGWLNGLLAKHDMGRVIIDTRPIRNLSGGKVLEGSVYQRLLEAQERKPNLPIQPERTADFVFLRYIGHPDLEQNETYLVEWSECLAAWLREEADAYVFCHCPEEKWSPHICRRLHHLVRRLVEVGPLPWDDVEAGTARQGQLF